MANIRLFNQETIQNKKRGTIILTYITIWLRMYVYYYKYTCQGYRIYVYNNPRKKERKIVTTPVKSAHREACTRGCADGPAMWGDNAP
jgi:hypothetical protein